MAFDSGVANFPTGIGPPPELPSSTNGVTNGRDRASCDEEQLRRKETIEIVTNRKQADDPPGTLRALLGINCGADTVVTGMDGTRIWLKDAFSASGRQIGVTQCCFESAPCAWHAALSRIGCRGGQARRPD